jgi:hypothetical protein
MTSYILKSKKLKVISQLQNTLRKKESVTKESCLSYASHTLDLIEIANGKDSSTYLTMKTLLYDDSVSIALRQINSTDDLIMHRINMNSSFDNIINDSIHKIKLFGLYNPPKIYNNFLGKWTDYQILGSIVAICIALFKVGYFFGHFFFENPSPHEKQEEVTIEEEDNSQKTFDHKNVDTIQIIH